MGSSILSKSAILYIVEVRENIDKVTITSKTTRICTNLLQEE